VNKPAYDVGNFSFGPGVLYLGVVGETPTIDVGAVGVGAHLLVKRQLVLIEQGSPQNTAAEYAVKENVELSVTGLEWNLLNIARFIGAGVTSSSAAGSTFSFGGDMNVIRSSLLYLHYMPNGDPIEICLWDAQPTGESQIQFNDNAPHEFPFTFGANDSLTDWSGNGLNPQQRLCKVRRGGGSWLPPGLPNSMFTSDNCWNIDITDHPVAENSMSLIAMIQDQETHTPGNGRIAVYPGRETYLSPPGITTFGIPLYVVRETQPFIMPTWVNEVYEDYYLYSDPEVLANGIPIPDVAKQSQLATSGDRSLFIYVPSTHLLYCLYQTTWNESLDRWECGGGWIYDVRTSDSLFATGEVRSMPSNTCTYAGLCPAAGFLRYDDLYGTSEINHAFDVATTRNIDGQLPARKGMFEYGWSAPGATQSAAPLWVFQGPAGTRLRLKSSFDTVNCRNGSTFIPSTQRFLRALKKYGAIVCDASGDAPLFFAAMYDARWPTESEMPGFGYDEYNLDDVKGSDFEVVESSFRVATLNPVSDPLVKYWEYRHPNVYPTPDPPTAAGTYSFAVAGLTDSRDSTYIRSEMHAVGSTLEGFGAVEYSFEECPELPDGDIDFVRLKLRHRQTTVGEIINFHIQACASTPFTSPNPTMQGVGLGGSGARWPTEDWAWYYLDLPFCSLAGTTNTRWTTDIINASTFGVSWTCAGISSDASITNDTSKMVLEVWMCPKLCTLTYLIDGGGGLQGTAVQHVHYGADGTEVVAYVEDEPVHFDRWSDGHVGATRQDLNITSDLTVTAYFV